MRLKTSDQEDGHSATPADRQSLGLIIPAVLIAMIGSLIGSSPLEAGDELRPWIEASFGFEVSPRGVAADFSRCGNWLVYANSTPGDNEIPNQSIRINVIDSSADDPAEWERVAKFPLQPGFALPARATAVAFHPEHDAFAVGTGAAGTNGDGVAFFDASDPDPNNWLQVQIGDITLEPFAEGTSLSFSSDGAFLVVGMGIFSLQDDPNLGWEVFDTSDPDPANWEFAIVVPTISSDNATGGSVRDSAFSPDGNVLVMVHHTEQQGNSSQHITVINSSSDEWFAPFIQPNVSDWANGVDFHPSGEWFVVAYSGGIALFETATMQEVDAFNVDLGGSGVSARFSPDGDALAVGYFSSIGNESVRWIDTSSSDPADWARDSSIGPTNQPSSARDITFSPGGDYVAMAHRESPFASVGRRVQAPTAPREVSAEYLEGSFDPTLGQGDVEVAWVEPMFDGGGGIDRYMLVSLDGAFETVSIDADDRDVVVTFDYNALSDTSVVPIELVAVGAANLASPAEQAIANLPSAPGVISDLGVVGVDIDGNSANWQFAWQPPADDGGDPLTGYSVFVEFAGGGVSLVQVDGEGIDLDFGLAGGQIQVSAVNNFGESSPVSINVPELTEPALSDLPMFSAASSADPSLFEITITIDPVTSWGSIDGSEAGPGDYVFTYPGNSGPIKVIEPGGSGTADISATLAIPASELVVGQAVEVKARNELGLASAKQSTAIPVLGADITGLANPVLSQPSWDDDAQSYSTNLSWADYQPFTGSDSALALLASDNQPAGIVSVVVTNSPPVSESTETGSINLLLDNSEAPDFGDAAIQVRLTGLGDDELASPEVIASIPSAAEPPAPTVSVTNPRFVDSTLFQDIVVAYSNEDGAPIVDIEIVAADDGVMVQVEADEQSSLFSGELAIDLSIADYQNPEIGSARPAAELALIDAAGVAGVSQLAEAAEVPDPAPLTISSDSLDINGDNVTIRLAVEISDLNVAGPTDAFNVTVGGTAVQVTDVEGSGGNPVVSVSVPAIEIITDTEVTISRTSVTGAESDSASIIIEGLGDELFYDDFEAP